jgi:hypothetical protein
VLIDPRNLWKLHGRWIVGASVLALAAVTWVVVGSIRNGRWPGGGSVPGLVLGTLAAGIFLFEVAIVFKKTRWFRTARWALSAQTWMKAHIWLGLLTVPLVVLHSPGSPGWHADDAAGRRVRAGHPERRLGLALQNRCPSCSCNGMGTIYSHR